MSGPVYAIAQITVNDLDEYIREYGLPTGELIAKAGGEVLAATPAAQVVEGKWDGNWTVIFRFPDAETMSRFYNSEAYAPLKKARVERLASASNLVSLPAFNPAALG